MAMNILAITEIRPASSNINDSSACSFCDSIAVETLELDHNEYYFCICQNCVSKMQEKFMINFADKIRNSTL